MGEGSIQYKAFPDILSAGYIFSRRAEGPSMALPRYRHILWLLLKIYPAKTILIQSCLHDLYFHPPTGKTFDTRLINQAGSGVGMSNGDSKRISGIRLGFTR